MLPRWQTSTPKSTKPTAAAWYSPKNKPLKRVKGKAAITAAFFMGKTPCFYEEKTKRAALAALFHSPGYVTFSGKRLDQAS
jgi:hypothetical protein